MNLEVAMIYWAAGLVVLAAIIAATWRKPVACVWCHTLDGITDEQMMRRRRKWHEFLADLLQAESTRWKVPCVRPSLPDELPAQFFDGHWEKTSWGPSTETIETDPSQAPVPIRIVIPTKTGREKFPPDGFYRPIEGLQYACTCGPSCADGCPGILGCKCEACFQCYADYGYDEW